MPCAQLEQPDGEGLEFELVGQLVRFLHKNGVRVVHASVPRTDDKTRLGLEFAGLSQLSVLITLERHLSAEDICEPEASLVWKTYRKGAAASFAVSSKGLTSIPWIHCTTSNLLS